MRRPLLTIHDACRLLQVGHCSVRSLIDGGDVTAYKVKGVWRIEPDSLDAYLESRRNRSAAPPKRARATGRLDADDLLPVPEVNPFV